MGFTNSEGIRPADALNRLGDWFRNIECVGDIVGVWSHGPAFDITILSNLYNTCPPDYMLFRLPPWNYRTIRDTRTLVFALETAGLPVPPYPAEGTAHNALDDARNQAEWVRRMYGTLMGEEY